MWCGLCVKRGKKVCYRKSKLLTRKLSPACIHFRLETRKIPAKILSKAMELGTLNKTHIRMLIALLDQNIQLKSQGLNTGIPVDYEIDVQNNGKLTTHKVYLVSAPKRSQEAFGVVFLKDPKNATVSLALEKELFIRERDRRLKEYWNKIQAAFLVILEPKEKRRTLIKYFKIIGKQNFLRMLRMNGIKLRATKAEDIITKVLRTYL